MLAPCSQHTVSVIVLLYVQYIIIHIRIDVHDTVIHKASKLILCHFLGQMLLVYTQMHVHIHTFIQCTVCCTVCTPTCLNEGGVIQAKYTHTRARAHTQLVLFSYSCVYTYV